MILIKLNDDNFEYDIYSLVKAFYPKEDITFTDEIKPDMKDNLSYFLVINYRKTTIDLELYKPEESNLKLIYEDSIDVYHSDRKDTKNRLKRLIYYCFNKETGRNLPWGTLSGIRPTKIPLSMVEQGMSDKDIQDYMDRTYLASHDKIKLSIDIARHEHELIGDINDESYSLYIGIPFCPTTCLYCSFSSYTYGMWQNRIDDYLKALKKEIDFISNSLSLRKLTTIYIGGGTPTSLKCEELDTLLSIIDEAFPVKELLEYTLEAGRPDSITRDKLKVIKKHGVSRISINPQTMNDKTLKLIGRAHTTKDIISSYEMAREEGFDNINMDIIVGLPGEDIDDLKNTLSEIEKLGPDSLTVHSLAIKRSAKLNIYKEEYEDMLMYNSAKHMEQAAATANKLGMEPYYLYRQKNMAGNLENIGFAKSKRQGLYNVLIMEEKQSIIALGAGAACKYVSDRGKRVTRSENVKDPGLYIDRIDEMIDRKKEKLEELGWLTS